MQLLDLPACPDLRLLPAARIECPRSLLLQLLLPRIHLIGMDLVAHRQIGNARILAQSLQCDPRLQPRINPPSRLLRHSPLLSSSERQTIQLSSWSQKRGPLQETGFRECGLLYLAETAAELETKLKWYEENARPYGLSSRPVSGAEAETLQPGAAIKWAGGLYTPDDGRAEPTRAAPAIAEAARRKGAKIFTHCAVRGIETSGGRVSGVVAERGRIDCSAVVLAGGAWSRLFLGNLGIPFPQAMVVNSVMRSAPLEAGVERSCSAGKFAFRRRLDGGYTIAHRHLSVADIVPETFSQFFRFLPVFVLDHRGLRLRMGKAFLESIRRKRRWRLDEPTPFEDMRILDPDPVDDVLDEALASLQRLFPAFGDVQIVERWAGCIDATPDAIPVISPIASLPGLFLASGFSGHGFGIGPGAGRLMADLVTGQPPVVDPMPFRYSRYFDGSNPRPTTV